jgi:hypothetical protein
MLKNISQCFGVFLILFLMLPSVYADCGRGCPKVLLIGKVVKAEASNTNETVKTASGKKLEYQPLILDNLVLKIDHYYFDTELPTSYKTNAHGSTCTFVDFGLKKLPEEGLERCMDAFKPGKALNDFNADQKRAMGYGVDDFIKEHNFQQVHFTPRFFLDKPPQPGDTLLVIQHVYTNTVLLVSDIHSFLNHLTFDDKKSHHHGLQDLRSPWQRAMGLLPDSAESLILEKTYSDPNGWND